MWLMLNNQIMSETLIKPAIAARSPRCQPVSGRGSKQPLPRSPLDRLFDAGAHDCVHRNGDRLRQGKRKLCLQASFYHT